MKRGWQYTGAAFAALFAVWAQQAWQLSLTDVLGPGPGFFPFYLAVLGLGLAVALVLQAGKVTEGSAPSQPHERLLPRGAALRSVALLFAALVGVALLLEPLGFRLTVALFCLLGLPTLGARNPIVIAVFASAASFGVYALFSDLLKVPLPVGLLNI